jgi:23S rRNA-/tRNA-specific pseudouridylate synthase
MPDTTHTPLDSLPLNKGVHVLAHNEDGLLALEKPPGAMSHPNQPEDRKRSLLNADYDLEQECYHWTDATGELRRAWLINRLDSPTSGVILLGLNPGISETIQREFASHKVSKVYYALVRGTPKVPAGSWADQLKKDVHRGGRLMKKAQIVPAKTRYQLVKSPTGGFPVTLIKLMPLTGRTHQLRVQCKKHGLPIVGDRTYGSFGFNREVAMHTDTKRMLLHSGETIVHYSYKGKVRAFTAQSELPEDFDTVMRFRPGLSMLRPNPPRSRVLAKRRFKA